MTVFVFLLWKENKIVFLGFGQVPHGVFARMVWVIQTCRRLWTMLVELGLTVTLFTQTGLVSTQTLLGHIAIMLSTAIFKERAKLKAHVIFLALPLSLHLTLVNFLPSICNFYFYIFTNAKRKKRAQNLPFDFFLVIHRLYWLCIPI